MEQSPLSLGLDEPERPAVGLTHVIDVGTPVEQIRQFLEMAGSYVSIWKFGFGTGYLDPTVAKKVSLLSEWGIKGCLGGTLLEAAWVQGRTTELLDWAADRSFPMVEVSNGAVDMGLEAKRQLISQASRRFTVIAEVGSKNPAVEVSAEQWAEEMLGDLAAGASVAVAEGRASGTVGLYTGDGAVRWPVAQALMEAVGMERLVFEAPQTPQQAALIRRFGPSVGLGNIRTGDVLALEALRRGLRGDTLSMLGDRKP